MGNETSGEPLGPETPSREGRTIDLEAAESESTDRRWQAEAQPAQSSALDEAPVAGPEPSHRDTDYASHPSRSRAHLDWKALIAGGLSGAVIAAACVAAWSLMIPDSGVKEIGTRLSRIEGQIGEAKSSPSTGEAERRAIEGLTSRVGSLEATITKLESNPADLASGQRLSALTSDLKGFSERISTLSQQIKGAADLAGEARQRGEANAAALADLAKKVASAGDVAGREKIAGELRMLSDRLGGLETALSQARAASTSGRLAVAAIALDSAVERGQPFAPELAAAKSLGADPKRLAALEPFAQSGIPSAATLTRELLDLLPSLRVAEPAPGNFLARLQSNAEKLVRIQSQQEKGGNDVSAILERIEIKARHADLGGALADIDELPPGIRRHADAWIEKARARSAAVRSSQELLAAALVDLSK